MQLFSEKKPHIKSKDTTNIIMSDLIIALSFLIILSFLYFGAKSLIIILSSITTCYILDIICISIRNKSLTIPDISSIVTGIIISLLLPASSPLYLPITASFFSILIIKQCFGGLGQNIFNPAAGGICFISLCWPELMFTYPSPDITASADNIVSNISYTLKLGGYPSIEILDMFLGKQPGPMGTVHILVILSCIIWLIMRKSVYFPSILSFLSCCAVIAFLFPRIHSARILSVTYELFSGSLLFGAVFMLTDPVTGPKYNPAKILYGGITGLLTMIFRYFGGFEQGICFAILIGNSISFFLDRFMYNYLTSHNNAILFIKKNIRRN